MAAMLLLTLPGTLTMYYGEELGMTNVPIAPDQVQDPCEKNEPASGKAAIRNERPCAGIEPGMPDSRRESHGCRLATNMSTSTLMLNREMTALFYRSIES